MENIVVMGEPNVSRARKKQAFNNSLKCSHIIGQFSDSLIKEAKSVAPFGGLHHSQKRMETHQKQQLAAGSSVKQLSPMQQLEAMIDKENVPPTPQQIKGKYTTRPNKRKTLTGMEFPTPKRDKHFTRVEFAQLLASHPEKAQRSELIKFALFHNCVPVGQSNLHRLRQQMETHIDSGGTIESFIAQLGPWNCRGRKPFLTITELEETAEEISQQPG